MGCDTKNSTDKYNIKVIYDFLRNNESWSDYSDFQTDFIENNRINAAYYNEGYIQGVTSNDEVFLYFSEAPDERIFVLNNETEFSEIFTFDAGNIDLENELVIVYMFASSVVF